MDKMIEERIRNLAQPLWESAAAPYGVAMDYWLMAEQMVLEAMAAATRLQDSVTNSPVSFQEPFGAAPVARVRELATCMWESAGRQYGVAQDFWLSAERHVLAMFRATAFPAGGAVPSWVLALSGMTASAYLDRIRLMAYHSWEAAGRGYGRTLDHWLQAEREMLETIVAATDRPAAGAASQAAGAASH